MTTSRTSMALMGTFSTEAGDGAAATTAGARVVGAETTSAEDSTTGGASASYSN